jgi:hypothetical protein
MIRLVRISDACPEQYDAFDEAGIQVGYLRLRHSTFRVYCPDIGGLTVYEVGTKADGAFEDDERDYYLRFAVDAIERWKSGWVKRPEPPNVEYEIVEAP